jgi:hypothetical protein
MKRKVGRKISLSNRKSGRTTAKGREIVASLAEGIEVVRAGLPIESRFIVRNLRRK